MDDIYRENILDHYKNPRNFGKLKNPTASFSLYNSACGDKIEIQLKMKNEKLKIIEDIRFSGEGCAISMASASMLTEKVMRKNIHEIKKLNTQDILDMLGITLTPTRLKCALLPLEVLQKAINS
ncbi:SUF system NifU family Fe-S cluster assembly protein [Candidatus Gottesmanbacteria bacterium]|nr:SUF system NifU family Fe-S cluster assembly protein [Candidatus Gottesmanbacteria bacterium]MBI5452883.1 SUF system NifU family Fe-S cluster assembly protein [Candidatus Gottesmanbacteria bacterium]